MPAPAPGKLTLVDGHRHHAAPDTGPPAECPACAPMRWMEIFETGIAELDQWHRRLVDECNELLALMAAEAAWPAIAAKTGDVVAHCIDHFRVEEAILERVRFPRREAHAAEHRRLEDHLRTLLTRVQGLDGSRPEDRDLPASVGPLIIDLMVRHDLDYRSHMLHQQGR